MNWTARDISGLRRRLNLSPSEFAVRLGTTGARVQRLESGEDAITAAEAKLLDGVDINSRLWDILVEKFGRDTADMERRYRRTRRATGAALAANDDLAQGKADQAARPNENPAGPGRLAGLVATARGGSAAERLRLGAGMDRIVRQDLTTAARVFQHQLALRLGGLEAERSLRSGKTR